MAVAIKSWACLESAFTLIRELQQRSTPSLFQLMDFLSLLFFILNSKNAFALSISQSSFALFVFLLVIQQAGFKLPASCDRARVGERTTFLFRWGFTTILSLLLIHALVFQALICWFSRKCLPPRHQKCCIHHQQSPPRSSHQRCSLKKSVLKNFAKFTGKHLRLSLFFNKVAGAACNFIKKETLTQVFCCEFYQISFCLVKSD